MRITDMITQVITHQLSPTASVGIEKGQQMMIQILTLGFKGLITSFQFAPVDQLSLKNYLSFLVLTEIMTCTICYAVFKHFIN